MLDEALKELTSARMLAVLKTVDLVPLKNSITRLGDVTIAKSTLDALRVYVTFGYEWEVIKYSAEKALLSCLTEHEITEIYRHGLTAELNATIYNPNHFSDIESAALILEVPAAVEIIVPELVKIFKAQLKKPRTSLEEIHALMLVAMQKTLATSSIFVNCDADLPSKLSAGLAIQLEEIAEALDQKFDSCIANAEFLSDINISYSVSDDDKMSTIYNKIRGSEGIAQSLPFWNMAENKAIANICPVKELLNFKKGFNDYFNKKNLTAKFTNEFISRFTKLFENKFSISILAYKQLIESSHKNMAVQQRAYLGRLNTLMRLYYAETLAVEIKNFVQVHFNDYVASSNSFVKGLVNFPIVSDEARHGPIVFLQVEMSAGKGKWLSEVFNWPEERVAMDVDQVTELGKSKFKPR